MIRASCHGSSVSDQTYQSPYGPVAVAARRLEPRVVGRGVVHDEVGDHADPALVRRLDELAEVLDRAVVRVDVVEVGDVVAAVAERRRVQRQQPDAVDPEPLEVVELVGHPAQVARAVVVAVEERARVDLVEDGVLEPERVALEPLAGLAHRAAPSHPRQHVALARARGARSCGPCAR